MRINLNWTACIKHIWILPISNQELSIENLMFYEFRADYFRSGLE